MTDALGSALEGVRVVALATNIPGPIAAARLAEMGAAVVKIEPLAGDPLEAASPHWYAELRERVEVLRLDLRNASDRTRLEALLAPADIFVTTVRASALARAQLDWPALHARHPRLCQVAIVGDPSPLDDRAGHDLTYQMQAGLLTPPAMPRTVLADMAAAERAVWAGLAALRSAERTGSGVRVEVSIVEVARAFAVPLRHGLTSATGPLGGVLPIYRFYRARDGWVALAALEAHFMERLKAALGVESLDAVALAESFKERSCDELEELAARYDLPLAAHCEVSP